MHGERRLRVKNPDSFPAVAGAHLSLGEPRSRIRAGVFAQAVLLSESPDFSNNPVSSCVCAYCVPGSGVLILD